MQARACDLRTLLGMSVCDPLHSVLCLLLAHRGTVLACSSVLWIPNPIVCDWAGQVAEEEGGLLPGSRAQHEAQETSPGLQAPQHCRHDHREGARLHIT